MKAKLSKKTLLVFASSFMALSVSAMLASCRENVDSSVTESSSVDSSVDSSESTPVVTKQLRVVTQPSKTVFIIGQAFDATGLELKLYTLTDGVADDGVSISASSCTFSVPEGTVFTKDDISSSKEITITYLGNDDETYTATLTIVVRDYDQFAVVFKNENGDVLETDTTRENKNPSYDGENPTKAKNGDTYYLFDGWYVEGDTTQTVVDLDEYVVTGDVTFIAHYKESGEDLTYENLDYKIIDGKGYMVVGFNSKAEDKTTVNIPDEIVGQKVLAIADKAFSGQSTITSITIGDNVESIGENAFTSASNAKTLKLPAKLKTMGESAFSSCTMLKSVDIPGTLEIIPKKAFKQCTSLTELKLNEGLKTIDDEAFNGAAITKLDIPDSVTQILGSKTSSWNTDHRYSSGPFINNKLLSEIHIGAGISDVNEGRLNEITTLQKYTVSEDNPYLTAVDGILYSKDMKTLMAMPAKWAVENEDGTVNTEASATFTIPDSVETVAYRAFLSRSGNTIYVTKFVIGKNVKTIQVGAFSAREGCAFDFSNNAVLEKIEAQAFSYCKMSEAILPESVKYIGANAFSNNSSLTKVQAGRAMEYFGEEIFKSSDNAVMSFPEDADYFVDGEFLYNKDKTKALYFLGKASAPSNKTLVLPDTVREIADSFLYNVQVTSVTLNEGLVKIGARAFTGESSKKMKITSLTLPSTLREVGESAFQGLSTITSATLNDNLETIGAKAFYGLSKATIDKITIKEGTSVGQEAFSGCSKLKEVDYQADTLPTGCFTNCSSMTKVTLNNSITTLPSKVFSGCSVLAEINIPTSLTEIQSEAFKDTKKLVSLTLPTTLETIGDFSLSGMTSLAEIEIPASVTSFGKNAFKGNTSMTKAVLNNALETLPDYTFSGCTNLADVTLPTASLTAFGSYVFQKTAITSLSMPSTLTSIGDNAFDGCSKLTKVELPGVKTLGQKAFQNCVLLTEVTLSPEYETLSKYAFCGCTALANISLPSTLKEIKMYAFEGTAITSFTLSENVTIDMGGAFKNCKALKTVILNDSVTQLGNDDFNGASILTSVTGLSSVTSIGSSSFKNCTSLATLDLDASKVTSLSSNVFEGCSSLTEAFVPTNEKFTKLNDYLYKGNTALTSVTLPANVTSFGTYVFQNCSKLTTLTIEGDALATTNKTANRGSFGGSALATVNWENATIATAKALFTNAKTGLTKGTVLTLNCSDGTEQYTVA